MGFIAVVISLFIVCYYCVLGGWTLKFTVNSFSGNTGIIETFSVNAAKVIAFTAIFVLITLLIIAMGVEKGIERMAKILMPILFVLLVGTVIYSLTLGEGVREGLEFYLKPDFSKLDARAVLLAMGQAFYSLSLGMGIMITYGSYTGKEISLTKSAAIVCTFDTIVALLAGLAIFPAVAHFNPELLSGSKGIVLMFDILPQVFDSMGFIGKFVSFFFFAMVAIAAITSLISLYEVCTQFIIQKFRIKRKISAIIVGVICFAVSIPIGISLGRVAIAGGSSPAIFGMDWLSFFDEVTNTVLMPVCAFFGCLVVGWLIKPKRAIEEMEADGTRLPLWLAKVYPIFVKFITPALILAIEIAGLIDEFRGGNSPVVFFAYGLFAVCVAIYYLFFFKTDTGTNEDEKIAEKTAEVGAENQQA